MTPHDDWMNPYPMDAVDSTSHDWHLDRHGALRAGRSVMAAVGRKRALAAALSIVGWVLPWVAHASPGIDPASTIGTAKKPASWRDGFIDVRPQAATKTSASSAPRQAVAGTTQPTAATSFSGKPASRVTAAQAVSAPPQPMSAAQSAAVQAAVGPSPPRGVRDASTDIAAKTPNPVPPNAAPATWVAQAPAPVRASHPVYGPAVVPPASAQSDSAAVSAASRQAGASTVADSSTVAASVFSQWLDDKPDDEVTRGGLSAMTEAQLRQRFHDAIMVAVKRSPNVQQALAQWEATRYDVANARGRRLPQVQLSGQSATKTFGGPSQTGNPNVDAAVSVNVTTPVFDWGGARKVEQSNRQLAAAAEQGYHATLEGTALDVSNTLL
jgi:adhesin transport system outer membrane protein